MKKLAKPNLIYTLTAFVILFCFLILNVGIANAWFTSSDHKGVYVVFNVGQLNVNLYQVTKDNEDKDVFTEVYSANENTTAQEKKYINLQAGIFPDEFVELKLVLENKDAGGAIKIRYKLDIYACGATDTLIACDLAVGENINKVSGYYYYQNGDKEDVEIDTDAQLTLCEGFSIPYSSFNGLYGGETIKLVFTVEVI